MSADVLKAARRLGKTNTTANRILLPKIIGGEKRYFVNPGKLGPLGNLPVRYEPEGAVVEGENGRLFQVGPKGKLKRISHRRTALREEQFRSILQEKLAQFDERDRKRAGFKRWLLALIALFLMYVFNLVVFHGAL